MMFIGNPRERLINMYKISCHKITRYKEGRDIDPTYLESYKYHQRWKKVPPKLTKVISIMYGSKDREYGLILSRFNLERNYSIRIDFERILQVYQVK